MNSDSNLAPIKDKQKNKPDINKIKKPRLNKNTTSRKMDVSSAPKKDMNVEKDDSILDKNAHRELSQYLMEITTINGKIIKKVVEIVSILIPESI
jgi:hypothetical protein